MKDYDTIFMENIKQIGALLEKMDFSSCFKCSMSLTNFCTYIEHSEYVFICEVLEGVFSQVGPIVDNIELPEEEIREFMPKMQTSYNNMVIAIERKNKTELFDSLISIRFIATLFQLKWKKIGKSKPTKKGMPIPPPIEEMMKKMLVR